MSDTEFITNVGNKKGYLYYFVGETIPGRIEYDGLGHFMIVATLKYSKVWDMLIHHSLGNHAWGWVFNRNMFCKTIKDVNIDKIPEIMSQGKTTSDLFKQAWKEFSEQINSLQIALPNIAYLHMGYDYNAPEMPPTPCYCPLCTVSPLTKQSGKEGMDVSPNSYATNNDEIFLEMLAFYRNGEE